MIVKKIPIALFIGLALTGCASRAGTNPAAGSGQNPQHWVAVNAREIRLAYADAQIIEMGYTDGQHCTQLAADTLAVHAVLPSPDGQLTGDLSAMVANYLHAAQHCDATVMPVLTDGDADARAAERDARAFGSHIWHTAT